MEKFVKSRSKIFIIGIACLGVLLAAGVLYFASSTLTEAPRSLSEMTAEEIDMMTEEEFISALERELDELEQTPADLFDRAIERALNEPVPTTGITPRAVW